MFALTACWLALSSAALPAPTRWVTDQAQLLSPEARSRLDARLEAYERQTGHQVLVYLAPTTGGVPVEDLANEAFAEWGVGRANLDDGLVLFVFPEDRTARIEVGYGLEERVPDAIASRIIREVLAPRMAAGQADQAISLAVDALLRALDAPEGAPEEALAPVRRPPTPLEVGLMVAAGIGLLLLFRRHPGLALFLLSILFRHGGGGGGGGGFGGRGGRSGGGGATGRW